MDRAEIERLLDDYLATCVAWGTAENIGGLPTGLDAKRQRLLDAVFPASSTEEVNVEPV